MFWPRRDPTPLPHDSSHPHSLPIYTCTFKRRLPTLWARGFSFHFLHRAFWLATSSTSEECSPALLVPVGCLIVYTPQRSQNPSPHRPMSITRQHLACAHHMLGHSSGVAGLGCWRLRRRGKHGGANTQRLRCHGCLASPRLSAPSPHDAQSLNPSYPPLLYTDTGKRGASMTTFLKFEPADRIAIDLASNETARTIIHVQNIST